MTWHLAWRRYWIDNLTHWLRERHLIPRQLEVSVCDWYEAWLTGGDQ